MALNRRKLWRWLVGITLTPVLLLIALAVSLYIPAMQRYVKGVVEEKASEALGMSLRIGELRLQFPLELSLRKVSIERTKQDTFLTASRLDLAVNPLPLIYKRVSVPRLYLREVYVNQKDSTNLGYTVAKLSQAELRHLHLNMDKMQVHALHLTTDGLDVKYYNIDTTKVEDKKPIKWKINAQHVELSHTSLHLEMPLDSIHVEADLPKVSLSNFKGDLAEQLFELGVGQISQGSLTYDRELPRPTFHTLTPKHIGFKHLNLRMERLYSRGRELKLYLKHMELSERSGIDLEHLGGAFSMDSLRLGLKNFTLRTPYSELYTTIEAPWQVFSQDTLAPFAVDLDAKIGFSDIKNMLSMNDMLANNGGLNTLKELKSPLELSLSTYGTLSDINISEVKIKSSKVIDLSLEGQVYNILNSYKRRGRFALRSTFGGDVNKLLSAVAPSISTNWRIPDGTKMSGDVDLAKGYIISALDLSHQKSKAYFVLNYTEESKNYLAHIWLEDFDLKAYMPRGDIGLIDAEVNFEGKGYQILRPTTSSKLRGRVAQIQYKDLYLEDITFDGALQGGEVGFTLNSFNKGLNLSMVLDGLLSPNTVKTSFLLDSEDIDFKALGFSDKSFGVKFKLRGEAESNLKENYQLSLGIQDMLVHLDGDSILPKEVDLKVITNSKSSHAKLSSGDFLSDILIAEPPSAISSKTKQIQELADRLVQEVRGTSPMNLRVEDILYKLPTLNLSLQLGTNNALKPYLAQHRLALESLKGQISISPQKDLEASLEIKNIRADSVRISHVNFDLNTLRIARESKRMTDSMRLEAKVSVNRSPYKSQPTLHADAHLNASLQDAFLFVNHLDENRAVRNRVKLNAGWDGIAYRVSFPERELVFTGQTFRVNKNNIIALGKHNYALDADLSLSLLEREVLKLMASYSPQKEQNISLSVKNLHLQDYRSLGLPDVRGIVFAEVNYLRNGSITEQPIVTGDISIQELGYGDKTLGHFATALFYEPRSGDSHYVTADMSYNGQSSLSLNGIYTARNVGDELKGSLLLKGFPLEIANPFMSEYKIYLSGRLNGELDVAGSVSKPLISGLLLADRGQVDLQDYSTKLALDTIPLRIDKEQITFDQYAIKSLADKDNPIYLDGRIGILGNRMMQADLRINMDDVTLMDDAKPKSESQVLYGKLIASADLRLFGKLDEAKLRGRLGVLGGTNCTYVMREALLDTSDKSKGLVSFKDFSDTLFMKQPDDTHASLGGVDMNVSIHIDPSVSFDVHLTPDGRDYMKMQGGGNLQLVYAPHQEMILRGRYEMSGGGTLQYTLPVVGSKLFSVKPDSYISFDGNPRNPNLNFTAVQRVRASTGETNGAKTNFDVSIKAKNTLDNIDLSFDLATPENLSVQNTLANMSAEERGKQAIGLLATGTFLASGSSGGNFNLNETFSSLLQSQINNLAGNILQGTDLSVGMEMNDGSRGSTNTSYTYSFSRRFYSDRIRVVIGGKIHTDASRTRQEKSFIDNASLEYQIDKYGERFIQLYFKQVTDNVVEGEYGETAGGIILKRCLNRLKDIFRFRTKKSKASDSTNKPPIRRQFVLPTVVSDSSTLIRSSNNPQTNR